MESAINKIFTVSGVSGSGKTTIMKEVMDNELISVTTRKPREGESEGGSYYFISNGEYKTLFEEDKLVESSDYSGHGNYYGLTKDELESKIENGHCYFICDYNGMEQIKEFYPNCVSIYLLVSKEDAEQRMKLRGDTEENINKRLSTYEEEIQHHIHYDYVIWNKDGQMDEAVKKIKEIINSYSKDKLSKGSF